MPVARGRWLVGAGVETVERCDIPLTTATIGTIICQIRTSAAVHLVVVNSQILNVPKLSISVFKDALKQLLL